MVIFYSYVKLPEGISWGKEATRNRPSIEIASGIVLKSPHMRPSA